MQEKVSGIILAGGQSRRMGRSKALLRLGEKSIIERVVAVLAAVAQEVLVVTNEPADYRFLGLPLVQDRVTDRGPLGGLHAGLLAASWEKTLVLPCDLPLMEACVLRLLLAAGEGYAVTVPVVRGYPEPLVGLYTKACLPAVEAVLRRSERPRVADIYAYVPVRYLDESEIAALTDVGRAFLNINTPADWERAILLLEENLDNRASAAGFLQRAPNIS